MNVFALKMCKIYECKEVVEWLVLLKCHPMVTPKSITFRRTLVSLLYDINESLFIKKYRFKRLPCEVIINFTLSSEFKET